MTSECCRVSLDYYNQMSKVFSVDCCFYLSIATAARNPSVQGVQPENWVFGSERGEFATLKIAVAKVAGKRILQLCWLDIAAVQTSAVEMIESFSLWEDSLENHCFGFRFVARLVTFIVIASDSTEPADVTSLYYP